MEAGKTIRKKKRPANPLVAGIEDFIRQQRPRSHLVVVGDEKNASQLPKSPLVAQKDICQQVLQSSDLPKRYTLYEPMLLLGPSFPTHSPAWTVFYDSLTSNELEELHRTIADIFCQCGHHITHVALNAPIQMNVETELGPEENWMRSPSNLQPLFGNFGPSVYAESTPLITTDFDEAFWVSASQISGIKQVWAPRWTMFSRGNVREKSRILGQQGTFPGLSEAELDRPLAEIDVMDFFVGIGYFAFSYLKRGVRRVFGWDLNPWSIEGLRRGCEKNGWSCLVLPIGNDVHENEAAVEQVVEALGGSQPPRCVAFCGDNRSAASVMDFISLKMTHTKQIPNIRHCNLGLLPTSQVASEGAVRMLNDTADGWLHVHENAETSQVKEKEREVVDEICAITKRKKGERWQVMCERTEMVKTYAPGVGHYVFDIKLWPAR